MNKLSVIIPTLNEEEYLPRTLACLKLPGVREVIIADGGSHDQTTALARRHGCRLVNCPARVRGRQLNMGAAIATGTQLFFLHADSCPPPDFPNLINNALQLPKISLGAFSLAIAPTTRTLAWLAAMANRRSRWFSLPYGDQGFFLERSCFLAAGGFAELPIMEDFIFARKMNTQGRVIILSQKVTTSARRWQNLGPLRVTLINQLMICGYVCRIPASQLAHWYRRLHGLGRR
jgi:rSAM/selenodomain-associated transferase 2